MAKITVTRRSLRAPVEPLLHEGEACSVAAAPSEYEKGLAKLRFSVTVTVGPAKDEASAERLDELLSGAVKDALEALPLRPIVTRTSGYQVVSGPEGESLLGATFTAEILE